MAFETLDALNNTLQGERIRLYETFFLGFGQAIAKGKIDLAGLTEMYMKLALVGGDRVIRGLRKFQDECLKSVKTKNMFPVMAVLGKVILEMRKDLNPDSKTTVRDILDSYIKDIGTSKELLAEIGKLENK